MIHQSKIYAAIAIGFSWVPLSTPAHSTAAPSTISAAAFGALPDGAAIELYTLRNHHGMQAEIATYGGILTSLTAPDRHGRYADVVLGYDSLTEYLKASPYFGALVGRYANRVAKGQFNLHGHEYTLAKNNGPNSLHGGLKGFDKVVWTVAKADVTPQGPQLTLTYLSKDGEEGYPGNLRVTATYTLTEDNACVSTTPPPRITKRSSISRSTRILICAAPAISWHTSCRFTPVDSRRSMTHSSRQANCAQSSELRLISASPPPLVRELI